MRRYYESEFVPVADLAPGDDVLARRQIITIVRSEVQAVVTFDDGTVAVYDLSTDPALEVVVAGLRD